MVHILHFAMNVVHHYPALVGSIAGTSLLIPFAYYIHDSKKHPEKYKEHWRGVAQLGRALALGASGRRFESYHPDSLLNSMQQITLEELDKNFDEIFERAEKGETFHIMCPDGRDVILAPTELVDPLQRRGVIEPYSAAAEDEKLDHDDQADWEELYTNHSEGSWLHKGYPL